MIEISDINFHTFSLLNVINSELYIEKLIIKNINLPYLSDLKSFSGYFTYNCLIKHQNITVNEVYITNSLLINMVIFQ
jgi:hypothetical protein